MTHTYQISFDDFWGKESALVSKQCILYDLKMNLIKKLLSEDILDFSDMDDRNKTPHVRLCDKKLNPRDQKCYDKINGQVRTLSINDINFHNDWIDIDLGHSGSFETHMTLVYKKKIGSHKDKILPLMQQVIAELKPAPIVQVAKSAEVSASSSYVIAGEGEPGQKVCLCPECETLLRKLKACQCMKSN